MLAAGHTERIRPKLCTVQVAKAAIGWVEGTKRHPYSNWVRDKTKRSISGLLGKISPISGWLRVDRATSPEEKTEAQVG